MARPRRPHHRATPIYLTLAACLIAGAGVPPVFGSDGDQDGATEIEPLSEAQAEVWARVWEEHRGHELIRRFSQRFEPSPLALVGVAVAPMTGAGLQLDQTVLVEHGRITAVGPRGEVEVPPEATLVAGADKFVIPGLTEAHSHTISSLSQFLVYLTRGVTTLREMDGFPWMLEARRQAAAGELLIPNLYVAGHILSNRAWDFYMTQVDNPEEAAARVREQAAAGYDFIKIHNSLPGPIFDSLFEAAAAEGLDVVGHIPNEIPIVRAVSAGLRTNEHFKGYIFDQTLEVTDQDYVGATRGSEMWNVPTFANYHDHLRGAESLEVVTAENSLRFVPRWLRDGWLRQAEQPVDELTALRQTIYPKSRRIFLDLWPEVTRKFVAGTDTGTYAMMVPGFALQEEVRIFESLGMTPREALETATINPALAMRREAEFGTIEVGKRADLVVLEANPLESTEHLREIFGVAVRGTWLGPGALEEIRSAVELAFSESTQVPEPSRAELARLVTEMERLSRRAFPYPDYVLSEVGEFLTDLGQADLASRVADLRR